MNIELLNSKLTYCNQQIRQQVDQAPQPRINPIMLESVRAYEREHGIRTNEEIKQGLQRTKPFVKTVNP